jgi:glycosyltransferase involved in cell wall biosynthesis
LASFGLDRERMRVILPPVDLNRFTPSPVHSSPFTVLFASSPDKASWLEARGVPQILDAAALRPQMIFRLLWRPWGDSEPVVRRWIRERGLSNVHLEVGKSRDMSGHYRSSHVCLAPFTDASRSKPAPNSIVESLACGRPVVVTPTVGLADLILEGKGGLVTQPSGEALAESLDRLQADWTRYSLRARGLAEQLFGVTRFVTAYEQLYRELLPGTRNSLR